jgi:hypothetical protein
LKALEENELQELQKQVAQLDAANGREKVSKFIETKLDVVQVGHLRQESKDYLRKYKKDIHNRAEALAPVNIPLKNCKQWGFPTKRIKGWL